MTDYRQPAFYRFNEDSLRLVGKVRERISRANAVLDLGAGCGIIGIEIARALAPSVLDLVELQPDYLESLQANLAFLPSAVTANIHICSIGNYRTERKYDLIVSNPPYYLPGHGEASADPRRGLARSFSVDGWSVLLARIEELLSDEGHACLIVRNEAPILREIERALTGWKLSSDLTVDHRCALIWIGCKGR